MRTPTFANGSADRRDFGSDTFIAFVGGFVDANFVGINFVFGAVF